MDLGSVILHRLTYHPSFILIGSVENPPTIPRSSSSSFFGEIRIADVKGNQTTEGGFGGCGTKLATGICNLLFDVDRPSMQANLG